MCDRSCVECLCQMYYVLCVHSKVDCPCVCVMCVFGGGLSVVMSMLRVYSGVDCMYL